MTKRPTIFSTLSSSFRRRRKAAGIVETPSPSALARGPDRKLAGLRLGTATFPLLPINRRFASLTFALLAALAATLLLLLPGGPVQGHDHPVPADHDTVDHIHYAENGTRPVRSFASTDPEDARIEWNVRGVDAADFDISSAGVLTFINSPDFENPTDRSLDANNDGDLDDDKDFTAGDNAYQITVSATEMSDALPAKRSDMAITVTVENANDPGEVTLQWLQPEVGTSITATLTDSDVGITDSTWTWYTSKVDDPKVGIDFHWNIISRTAIAADEDTVSSYTPMGDTVEDDNDSAVDEGKHLRVKVDYADGHGASKTIYGISMNPVRAEVSSPGDNGSPDFVEETDIRTVPENMAVGGEVGLPVAAIDPDPEDKDVVTYTLDDDTLNTNALETKSDLQFFDIDRATGQITVAQELDYDAVGEDRATDAVAGTYTVVVRATDPSGLSDAITITIKAENANEAPEVTGRAELSVVEGTTDAGYTALPGDDPDVSNQVNRYEPEEQDYLDSISTWHLEGDDADAFDLSGLFEPRFLQFKAAPDYENPSDANKDNVYEVTIVATDTDPLDTGPGIGKTKVWVTVNNNGEAGEVVFTAGKTSYVNEMLVAEVQDPDDHGGDLGEPYQGVHVVTWQWSKSGNNSGVPPFVDIDGETTNRYTPTEDDRGNYLRVTATYTDPHSDSDDPNTMDDERIDATGTPPSLITVMATTEFAVRVAPGPESAPTFAEAVNGRVTRYVAEDAMPDDNVGDPVTAMGDSLAYTLEGSDAQYFLIDGTTGQITVGADTSFDYDDPAKPNTYQVTVKVEVTNRSENNEAEVQVDIEVRDIDEAPVITDVSGDSALIEVNFPEIKDDEPNTAAVATYVGTDPEGSTISWDLRGADAALFSIDGGVLKFRNAPDYEDRKDKDGEHTATPEANANENAYNIVIRAIASRASGYTGPAQTVDTTVIVTVTDVDESGEVVISWLQPEAGVAIMASVTDPDGPAGTDPPTTTAINPSDWTWEVSEVALDVLNINTDEHWGVAPGSGANGANYTPVTSDVGKHLRVTVEYTDRGTPGGENETESAMSAKPVQAAGGGKENGSPDFVDDKLDRTVQESAAVESNVGAPVEASVQSESAKDTLTYGLRAVGEDDLGTTGVTFPTGDGTGPDDDLAAFNINKATGQITVAQRLDFESRGDPDDGKYVVVVTATGPSGPSDTPGDNDYDDVVVVITAADVNEIPVLSGRPELTIDEINGGDAAADSPDFDGNPEPTGQDPAEATVNVYSVDDVDRHSGIASWRLEGVDADDFSLIDTGGRTLVFKVDPDYENPADADGDNVYKVTIVTIDNNGGRGTFDVCIAVGNVQEAGKVTLVDGSGDELTQPRARGAITAVLTDPDGSVTGVTWEWTKSPTSPNDNWPSQSIGAEAAYTPNNMEDIGSFLRATASYTDELAESQGAMATTIHSVLAVEDLKRAPAFPEEYAGGVDREIAENSPSTAYVGDPIVAAVDPDGMDVTYTLEGDDAAHFELAPDSRQIRVKGPVEVTVGTDTIYRTVDLNREAEAPKKKTYTVMLKASDGALDDTITVTITVTDRNEAPSTPMAATGAAASLSITPPGRVRYAEGNDGVVETYDTEGPGSDEATTWSLSGDDMAAFAISNGGMLTFNAVPDFEAPADADTDNTYEVTVNAQVGTEALTLAVTVAVTNEDEDGEVTLSSTRPAVEEEITATLADPDGGVTGTSWQWARSEDGSTDWTDIDTATSNSYTPVAADVGMFLRATASYSDREGSGKDASAESTHGVGSAQTTGSVIGDIYDVDEDGEIGSSEVVQAVKDYFARSISPTEVVEVVKLYFAAARSS